MIAFQSPARARSEAISQGEANQLLDLEPQRLFVEIWLADGWIYLIEF